MYVKQQALAHVYLKGSFANLVRVYRVSIEGNQESIQALNPKPGLLGG